LETVFRWNDGVQAWPDQTPVEGSNVPMTTLQDFRTIVVDAMSVRYCLDGPPCAPVVMFGNGLATSLEMWEAQAAFFAKRFRVLRYDVRGHGGTEATQPPYSLEQLADDAVALLDHLGVEMVTYVGLSLGGMIGQAMAVRHADRIGALVLCDTTMHSPRAMWRDRIAAVQMDGVAPQVEPSIARWFTPAFTAAQAALVDRMRRMIGSTSPLGYLGCAMAMRDMELEDVTVRIGQPTLVIVGRDDPSTPVSAAQALHAAIAGSELEIIDQAAHLPNIEQAERFNALLARFLDAHAR
jgi:3-oxoadipate enol-lactonase